MYRLQGSDASFLYQETPSAPMHTIKVYVIEPQGSGVLDWDRIVERTKALLPRLPVMRQRVVFVPMGLHHPVMIEDPDFDIDYHLCRAALPAPGGMRELEALVAQIGSHPLDQDRPLWEMWYVEGLEGGRGACIHKIHHALADGMATVAYINKVWSTGTLEQVAEDLPARQTEKIPGASRLIWDALVDHVKYDVRKLPAVLGVLWRGMRGVLAYSRDNPAPTLERFRSGLPRVRWNYALSPKRTFNTAQLSVAEARELKSQLGGTINDVVLAVVAGSLRKFLSDHHELPDRPLVTSIPVAADERGSLRDSGNRIASITTLLHVGIADPIRRYQAISQSTSEGKAELEAMGKQSYGLLLQYIPPGLLQWANRRNYRLRKANRADYLPLSNLSVSNVPGPRRELFDGIARVTDFYSIGPLLEGVGLNITVWSYADGLNFSILGCKKALPDLHKIGEGISDAFEELKWAAEHMDSAPDPLHSDPS